MFACCCACRFDKIAPGSIDLIRSRRALMFDFLEGEHMLAWPFRMYVYSPYPRCCFPYLLLPGDSIYFTEQKHCCSLVSRVYVVGASLVMLHLDAQACAFWCAGLVLRYVFIYFFGL